MKHVSLQCFLCNWVSIRTGLHSRTVPTLPPPNPFCPFVFLFSTSGVTKGQMGKGKAKAGIAVHGTPSHSYGVSLVTWVQLPMCSRRDGKNSLTRNCFMTTTTKVSLIQFVIWTENRPSAIRPSHDVGRLWRGACHRFCPRAPETLVTPMIST